MEFPATSQTRLKFWNQPQYTQNGMWWFTLFFGFFGLHHFLLRSPQTGLIMLIANSMLMGYPWLYDLIQMSTPAYGGLGTEGLNKYGMGHPLGTLGLGAGMWMTEEQIQAKAAQQKPDPKEPPSPWWFLLYCIALPCGFLSTLIAGDGFNALGRLGLLTVIPLGWFIGLLAMIYDFYFALVQPADLTITGTRRFFPFTLFGMDDFGHSPSITGDRGNLVTLCPPTGFVGGILEIVKFFLRLALPILFFVNPAAAFALEEGLSGVGAGAGAVAAMAKQVSDSAVTTMQAGEAVVGEGVKVADTAVKVVKTVGTLADTALSAAGAAGAAAAAGPGLAMGQLGLPARPGPSTGLENYYNRSRGTMVGGGQKTVLDWLAAGSILALVGGAGLLTIGRSLNAEPQGKNDTPPNARTI